jgi:hypothetical protein
MALNVGLTTSVDSMYGWKGMREKVWKINSTEGYITNDGTSH